MIIRDNISTGVSQLYTQRLQSTNASERKPLAAADGKPADRDAVEISSEALALQKSIETALAADDVRWDKVTQLRQQIQQGTYEVPVQNLVQKLLGEA